MPRFLIDANLPYRFSIWHGDNFEHVFDHNDTWSDLDIWLYAKQHDMVIVTKDADFSDWVMLSQPPPRVIHLRIGNMRLRDFHRFMENNWSDLCQVAETNKLIIVYPDRIECVS